MSIAIVFYICFSSLSLFLILIVKHYSTLPCNKGYTNYLFFSMGRYPVHFHMNGNMSQSYVKGKFYIAKFTSARVYCTICTLLCSRFLNVQIMNIFTVLFPIVVCVWYKLINFLHVVLYQAVVRYFTCAI